MVSIFFTRKTYKTTFFISVIGLALGLASLIVITLYLNYELNYDHWSPELKNVYGAGVLNQTYDKEEWSYYCDSRIGFALRSDLPDVKAITMIAPTDEKNNIGVTAGNNSFLENDMFDCDSSFFDVFPYKFIAGNRRTALRHPNTIVIAESLAMKWFGTKDVVGKSVSLKRWSQEKLSSYQIEGVIALPSSPSILSFTAIYHSGSDNMDIQSTDLGGTKYCRIFMRINPGANVERLQKLGYGIYAREMGTLYDSRRSHSLTELRKVLPDGFRIQSLKDIHVHPLPGKSVMDNAAPLIGLSVLLLLLAITNFTNLTVAESFYHVKSISIKKILGASRIHLMLEILGENTVKCFVALVLASLLSLLLLPFINDIFQISISIKKNINLPVFMFQLTGIFIITCLLSAIYPCLFLTNFSPLGAFRDENGSMNKRKFIGNALIVFQFAITVVFIISLVVMTQQISYMQKSDPGFSPTGLLHIESPINPRMIDEIQQLAGVKYAGVSSQKPNKEDNFLIETSYEGQLKKMFLISVGYETLSALNVQLKNGRLFSKVYGLDSVNTVILNKSAADIFGKNILGKTIYGGRDRYPLVVVGIINDYKYHGFEQKVSPSVYMVNTHVGLSNINHLLIKTDNHDKMIVIGNIKAIWERYYPGYPLKYTYLEDEFNQLNTGHERLKNVFYIFSIVSLLLALIGLFALTTFMIRQRLKEFSIRKTLGASSVTILTMISRKYLKLVVISNALAYPVVFFWANNWLDNFAYRINVPYGAFVVITIISLIVTGVTLAIQIGSIARVNPVKYLKGN
jgi:putative ABC transport system permease protein